MPIFSKKKKNDIERVSNVEDGMTIEDGLDTSDGGTKYVPKVQTLDLKEKFGGAASSYAHLFTDVARRSPFEQWNREALIDLIILNNIELRLEELIKDEQLVEVCNQLYAGKPVPDIPTPWTPEERALAERAALNIQRNWIKKKKDQRRAQMMEKVNNNRLFMDHGVFIPPDLDQEDDLPTPRTGFAELEKDWTPPDLAVSKEYQKYNHPRKGGPGGREYDLKKTTTGRYCILGGCGEQLDMWDEGKTSDLGQFGAGITTFFKFEKWCCWVFLFLAIIYLPQLMINTFGGGIDGFASYADISITTIGNLVGNNDFIEIPYCVELASYYELEGYSRYCSLDTQDISYLYSYIDVAAAIFFWVAFMWMKTFAKREGPELDGKNVSAGDYSIKITGMTQSLSEVDIKRHFKNAVGILPVSVSFAYNNTYEIAQYQLRGKLFRERTKVVHRYRYIAMMKETYRISKVWYLVRELPYLKRKSDILLKDIAKIDKNLITTEKRKEKKSKKKTKKVPEEKQKNVKKQIPLCCYVTFDDQHAVLQILATYPNTFWSYFRMPDNLRLKGERIKVQKAPEPSVIIWENLPYGYFSRMFRRFLTTSLAGLFIIVSIAIAFAARHFQESNVKEKVQCPSEFYDWTIDLQESWVTDSTNTKYLSCYCEQFSLYEQYVEEESCKTYMVDNTLDYFFTFFASFSVVMINYIMQLIIQKLTSFERHHTLDSQRTSTFVRLFILKFINTACVILLLHSKDAQKFLEVNLNTSENFEAEWYATAGVSLIFVMILNMFTPLLYLLQYWLDARKQRRMENEENRKHIMTQEDLNQLFIGPEFNLDFRYATLMVVLYTNFMYASVMPILAPIGALTFYLSYKIDKLTFLRFYRIPPQYGSELSTTVTNWVQYILFIHLLISVWSYAFSGIFQSNDEASLLGEYYKSYSERYISGYLFQGHVFPLMFALVLIFLWLLLGYISKGSLHLTRRTFSFFTCTNDLDQKNIIFNEIDISYRKALDRGLLKGLSNYNILQNPKYKAAFSISDKFASKHSNIESIRKLQTTDDDEDDDLQDSGNNVGDFEMGSLQKMKARNKKKHHSPRKKKQSSPPNSPSLSRASLSPKSVNLDL